MIILNEKEYAEDCLKYGLPKVKPMAALFTIAKYYYHHKGYKRERIESALHEFVSKHIFEYSQDRSYWDSLIERMAKNASKYPLREVDGVWITASELDVIKSLNDDVLERLMFTMLCIAKFNNRCNPKNDNWVRTSDKEVFGIARFTDPVGDRHGRIETLYRKGLIRLSNMFNASYRVEFLDEESDGVLFISDFRELGYEYRKYKGENFVHCAECGILIKGSKNQIRKYCAICKDPEPQIVKAGTCIDCGDLFWLKSKNNRSKRCPACQNKAEIEYKKQRNKRYYDKVKTLSISE